MVKTDINVDFRQEVKKLMKTDNIDETGTNPRLFRPVSVINSRKSHEKQAQRGVGTPLKPH